MKRAERDLLRDGGEVDEELVRVILERTSGSTCAAARGRLADLDMRPLASIDRELTALHLERCEPCRAVAEVAANLARDSLGLAERDPPAGFAEDVLRATSRRPPARRGERLRSLVARPRFAWEVAYAGTLLIMLAAGVPSVARLDAAPRAALAGVATRVEVSGREAAQAAERRLRNLSALGRQAVEPRGTWVENVIVKIGELPAHLARALRLRAEPSVAPLR